MSSGRRLEMLRAAQWRPSPYSAARPPPNHGIHSPEIVMLLYSALPLGRVRRQAV